MSVNGPGPTTRTRGARAELEILDRTFATIIADVERFFQILSGEGEVAVNASMRRGKAGRRAL
jgi:hypothetical protein